MAVPVRRTTGGAAGGEAVGALRGVAVLGAGIAAAAPLTLRAQRRGSLQDPYQKFARGWAG
ncbi:MAG: hypothetical protein ACKVWR_04380 [Acidimicrobiales bacterium]